MRISTITPFGYCTKAHPYVMFSKNEGICMSAELTAPHNQPPQEPGIVEPTAIDTGENTALRLENPTILSAPPVELSPISLPSASISADDIISYTDEARLDSPRPDNPPASTPIPDIILTPRQRRTLHYLARRRMRHARIIKRQPLANRTLTTGTPPATAIVLGTIPESEPSITTTTIPASDASSFPVNPP